MHEDEALRINDVAALSRYFFDSRRRRASAMSTIDTKHFASVAPLSQHPNAQAVLQLTGTLQASRRQETGGIVRPSYRVGALKI
jgi:N-acyl-L-homoserine lactone synthetase